MCRPYLKPIKHKPPMLTIVFRIKFKFFSWQARSSMFSLLHISPAFPLSYHTLIKTLCFSSFEHDAMLSFRCQNDLYPQILFQSNTSFQDSGVGQDKRFKEMLILRLIQVQGQQLRVDASLSFVLWVPPMPHLSLSLLSYTP